MARYTDDQRRRLAVKPGMTGPMQINGRGDLSFEVRLALELGTSSTTRCGTISRSCCGRCRQ